MVSSNRRKRPSTKVVEKLRKQKAKLLAAQPKPKPEKTEEQKKAIEKKIKQILRKGKRPRTRRVWHTVTFEYPELPKQPSIPKYPKRGIPKRVNQKMDKFAILKYPVTSDKAMKDIEERNTIVYIVHEKANKKQIRKAFRKMYNVKVEKVRTLIRPTGDKKAFIKLPKSVEAVDIANKIGIV